MDGRSAAIEELEITEAATDDNRNFFIAGSISQGLFQ